MPISQGCLEFLGIRSCRRRRNSARSRALQSPGMAGTISRYAVSPLPPQAALEALPASLPIHHGEPHAGSLRFLHADLQPGPHNGMGEGTERHPRPILTLGRIPRSPNILILAPSDARPLEWRNSCSVMLNPNWRITFLAMIRARGAFGEISAA